VTNATVMGDFDAPELLPTEDEVEDLDEPPPHAVRTSPAHSSGAAKRMDLLSKKTPF
jgi:hypothetical protein